MHRGCWTSTSSTSTRLILSRMTHSPTVTLAAKQMMSMTLYVNELQMCACTWSTSGPMMCSADVLCCRSRSWVNSRRHSAQMVCRHQTSFCASSKTTMTLSCAILSEATQGRNWVSALSRWTCESPTCIFKLSLCPGALIVFHLCNCLLCRRSRSEGNRL